MPVLWFSGSLAAKRNWLFARARSPSISITGESNVCLPGGAFWMKRASFSCPANFLPNASRYPSLANSSDHSFGRTTSACSA